MDMQQHLTDLSAQHSKLDQMIKEELDRPNADTLRLATLKRQKLRIKDEIVQLEQKRYH